MKLSRYKVAFSEEMKDGISLLFPGLAHSPSRQQTLDAYKPGFAGIQTTSASHTGVALSWSKIARLGVEHGWKSSFFMC